MNNPYSIISYSNFHFRGRPNIQDMLECHGNCMGLSATDWNYSIFMSEVKASLCPLIQCINDNYDPHLSRGDLEISFKQVNKGSWSYGNGKIVFGQSRVGTLGNRGEYKMFKKDPDLWTHEVAGAKFEAWWLTAHEISHEVVSRIRGECSRIPLPCVDNACLEITGSENPNDWPEKLVDLLKNQAPWETMKKSKNTYYLGGSATISSHGLFFQHIYRTLRRDVVNPLFDIEVGPWKQKQYSPPKKARYTRYKKKKRKGWT